MEAVRIPRHVDDPPHILLWSTDEIAPPLVGLFFGIIFAQMTICILIGCVVSYFYKRFKDNHADGVLNHMIYWSGIPITTAKHFPNPYIRRFFP